MKRYPRVLKFIWWYQVTVLIYQQVMRSTRNIFIVNMAVSGVLLCSFTMPLTLVDLLYKYWVLGTDQVDMTVSGALLCSFTMPLTLVDLLYKYWALGTDQVDMTVSGVLLCSFTMPLTLVDLLYKYWALGTDQVDLAVSGVLLCSNNHAPHPCGPAL
jgi:hypothetical protein